MTLNAAGRLMRALEAFEVGEHEFGVAIVEDLRRELASSPVRPVACGRCGLRFRWPGELDDHWRSQHEDSDQAECAS
jgi:hypothetical protein